MSKIRFILLPGAPAGQTQGKKVNGNHVFKHER